MLQLATPLHGLLGWSLLGWGLPGWHCPPGAGHAQEPTASAVRFGAAQPRPAAWTFRRQASSWMRCQVWLDGRPTRDEILEYDEAVHWTVQPQADDARGPGYRVEYLEDQRRPSLRGLAVFVDLGAAPGPSFVGYDELGLARFELRPPPRNLVEDQAGLDRPPVLARHFAGREFEPGDEAPIPLDELGSVLLTRATRLEEAVLRFRGRTQVGSTPAARFELWARGRTRGEPGVPESRTVLRGSLVLRLSDAAPLSVDAVGRLELDSTSQVEEGARLRVEGEGESVLRAEWTPGVR